MAVDTSPDLPYDYEDFGMTIDELQTKYPTGHPEYTVRQWRNAVFAMQAHSGYWEWVHSQISRDDNEA